MEFYKIMNPTASIVIETWAASVDKGKSQYVVSKSPFQIFFLINLPFFLLMTASQENIKYKLRQYKACDKVVLLSTSMKICLHLSYISMPFKNILTRDLNKRK